MTLKFSEPRVSKVRVCVRCKAYLADVPTRTKEEIVNDWEEHGGVDWLVKKLRTTETRECRLCGHDNEEVHDGME